MFIHDFVHVEQPLSLVLDEFARSVDPWLGTLVSTAWLSDREIWVETGIRREDLTPPTTVPVSLGAPRFRNDGVIVPISWSGGSARLFPQVEGDLEIAACGPRRTDLHLMGRYQLPVGIDRWTVEGSLVHRITISGVRRFLELLAARLEEPRLLLPAPTMTAEGASA
ncbi:MAG: hypothetical protein MUE34_03850 [Acidimicrobiales bacterium]|nr:hypothetical protein [Acidimicrobiales bacterium]